MNLPILKSRHEDIFFEFLIHKNPSQAIILLPGFPSSNNLDEIMRFFYSKGYNVFFPRFKGSYQSKGEFMKDNPVEDIHKFINFIKNGKAKSLWDLKYKSFKITEFVIITGSFGCPIACGLSTKNNLISKIILINPVWDFRKHNENKDEQDLNKLIKFVKNAYLNLYRIKFSNLEYQMRKFKEIDFNFYSSKIHIPILVLYDPKDLTVSYKHTLNASKIIPLVTTLQHNMGHKFNKEIFERYWNNIHNFLISTDE